MRLGMGRRRTKNLHLPAGVKLIGGRLFWRATSERERAERIAKELPETVPLGAAVIIRGRTELSREQRIKWAELSGYRDPVAEGTVAELLNLFERTGLKTQPNGLPRAESTVTMYGRDLKVLEERFGGSRYGRTAIEAAEGRAIGTAEIQRWLKESLTPGLANRQFAVLDNAFQHAILNGRTTYNPCRRRQERTPAARASASPCRGRSSACARWRARSSACRWTSRASPAGGSATSSSCSARS
jgi:hypothetical protein